MCEADANIVQNAQMLARTMSVALKNLYKIFPMIPRKPIVDGINSMTIALNPPDGKSIFFSKYIERITYSNN